MLRKLKSWFDGYKHLWDQLVEIHIVADTESAFPPDDDRKQRANVERYYYESNTIYDINSTPQQIHIRHNPTSVNPNSTLSQTDILV